MDTAESNTKKEVILRLMDDPMYKPMKIKEIAILLDIPKTDRKELEEVLNDLVLQGKIGISAKRKYGKPDLKTFVGDFFANQKGFGFVRVEGLESDVFIPEGKTLGAMHNDTVKIIVDAERKSRNSEGHVTEILVHANETVVGYYQKNKSYGFVMPDNQKLTSDIFIPAGSDMGAITGHKVVVHITDFGKNDKKPEGSIIEIIGHVNDPGTDIMSIVKSYALPEEFPEDVMKEIENTIAQEVTEAEKVGRKDLRMLQTVTIDGEDAKDLDDAITLTRDGDIWHLGVHIADVSHYVKEYSPLDKEALTRATSIYLVDRVIPMLPHKLSNGICSLNAGSDRLSLSCLMDIDGSGKLISHEIVETLINVDRRMTYTAVDAVITKNDAETCEKYSDFVDMFKNMKILADIIRKERTHRGSIDFDFPESKVVLNEDGKPIDIKSYDRNAATKLIEDFMLMANETVAEDYFWQQIPFLYRTHDNPDPEKLKTLATFINNFGFTMKTKQGEVHPKEVQKLLSKIAGSPAETLITRIALRSMKQARYTTECTGHFGLAAKYYTHFTSPIRRYPDLQIHRIIKDNLNGRLNADRIKHYEAILGDVAVQTSNMERRAEEAERETIKYKKCEYMQDFIGETYEGVICGVTKFGLYVELPNTVEGMVRVTDLKDDFYNYNEASYEMVGERTGKTYRLGEKMMIEVVAADKLTRNIDFRQARKIRTTLKNDDTME